jgi:cullin 3
MMVIARDGEKLYKNTKLFVSGHLRDMVQQKLVSRFPPISTALSVGDCELFLRSIIDLWEDHTTALSMIRDVMMYLDRTFLQARNLPLTYDVGLNVFRDTVIQSVEFTVEKHLIDALMVLFRYERDQEVIDRGLIKSIVKILNSLSSTSSHSKKQTLYDTCFEPTYLQHTKLYYEKESIESISKFEIPTYLMRVN